MELSIHNERVRMETAAGALDGALWLPDDATGLIVFANEAGGQRLRPSADYLPAVLRKVGLATLVVELDASERTGSLRDAEVLERSNRQVRAACDWAQNNGYTSELPLGLVGVGEGASATLHVATELGRRICALVVRSARHRPQAGLAQISAPTLLIAGSLDEQAVERTRVAYAALRCKKRFEIVPGATRSFDEPGALEVVARLARGWFLQHVHAAPAVRPIWRQ